MAIRYVKNSAPGSPNDGQTWTGAFQTLAAAAAVDLAGDTIYVADDHAESTAAAVTLAFAGTHASPVKIIGGNDAAEPPTAVAETATVTTTGANGITLNGTFYMRGIQFNNASGAVSASLSMEAATNGTYQEYEKCQFKLNNAGGTSNIQFTAGGSAYKWKNCDVKFAHVGQIITTHSINWHWQGGSILPGGTAPTSLVRFPGSSLRLQALIEGVDLTNGGASLNLTEANGGNGVIVFRNCKLPTSWAGTVVTGTLSPQTRIELHNCDSGDTNYKLWIEDYAGTIKHSTSIVRTGGASDGTTPISWQMVSSANAEYPMPALYSPEIASEFISTPGVQKTITVEIAHGHAALNDDEVWLEVQYLGQPGSPQQWLPSTLVSDAKADVLATAAAQTSSSETWSEGSPTFTKQKLSVTFTPQARGVALCRVVLAQASRTIYVDPLATVS